jgi:hypothetical protein
MLLPSKIETSQSANRQEKSACHDESARSRANKSRQIYIAASRRDLWSAGQMGWRHISDEFYQSIQQINDLIEAMLEQNLEESAK